VHCTHPCVARARSLPRHPPPPQDKQAESLRERLVARLQQGGPREWRLVAWCIGQLGYSEKGLRRVMELAPCYRHTLGEQQVCWGLERAP
jgi:hypothetical protein